MQQGPEGRWEPQKKELAVWHVCSETWGHGKLSHTPTAGSEEHEGRRAGNLHLDGRHSHTPRKFDSTQGQPEIHTQTHCGNSAESWRPHTWTAKSTCRTGSQLPVRHSTSSIGEDPTTRQNSIKSDGVMRMFPAGIVSEENGLQARKTERSCRAQKPGT